MKKKSIRKGYITVYLPDHPKAYDGFVYEHIVIAEKMIGRPLRENEHVHHLDLNEKNNLPENLIVLEHGQHTKIHNFIRRHNLENVFKATGSEGYHVKECGYCGEYLIENDKFCNSECRSKNKENRPSIDELEELMESKNKVEIGKLYGVHRTTINSWLRDYEVM